MIQCGAYGNQVGTGGFSETDDTICVLNSLEKNGRATKANGAWFLNAEVMAEIRPLRSISSPTRMFELRRHLALTDMSTYELALCLKEKGWTWKEWLSKSAIGKKGEAMPLGYK